MDGGEMATFGYAGKILRVDLSSGSITEVSTADYAARFLGGTGIAAKIYWDEVPPEVGAFDAENRLIFATGPLAGIPVIGGSRWQVSGKSAVGSSRWEVYRKSAGPANEQYSYCNLGGRWGAELKFTGYDALVVHGRAEKPQYLFIHDGIIELRDASDLWGKGSIKTREMLKDELGNSARVVTIGPAGENMVTIASLHADNDASGSGGLGAVMGSKQLKAIVVKGAKTGVKIAHSERLKELTSYYRELGVSFGDSDHAVFWPGLSASERTPSPKLKKAPCYGCLGRCLRRTYEADDGTKGKFMCGSAYFYQPWAVKYYGKWNDVPFYANRLCDEYGLDTMAVDFIVNWLDGCYRAGVLTETSTGLPLSEMGSLDFIETLIHKISFRNEFGDLLAQGIVKAAESLGNSAVEQMENTGMLFRPGYDRYGPRLYLTHSFIYAMEPREPIDHIHQIGLPMIKWVGWASERPGSYLSSERLRAVARRFWGSEMAADFSTFEGKALAAKMIQDREYADDCLILCDFLWPIVELPNTEDHIGDPTLESKLLSAVTGKEIDEVGLYRIGERVFNLRRAILVREGHRGRDFDMLSDRSYNLPLEYETTNPGCIVPGKDGEIISRKGAVVDREEFEKSKDEYYRLRQWDVATGLQTGAQLKELGLDDVAQDLEQRGLLAHQKE